jgi:hypothetical protein
MDRRRQCGRLSSKSLFSFHKPGPISVAAERLPFPPLGRAGEGERRLIWRSPNNGTVRISLVTQMGITSAFQADFRVRNSSLTPKRLAGCGHAFTRLPSPLRPVAHLPPAGRLLLSDPCLCPSSPNGNGPGRFFDRTCMPVQLTDMVRRSNCSEGRGEDGSALSLTAGPNRAEPRTPFVVLAGRVLERVELANWLWSGKLNPLFHFAGPTNPRRETVLSGKQISS